MTTKEAAELYEAQHQARWSETGYAVYNPHNKPIDELPFILGFNNGGRPGWFEAVAISEDGFILGSHVCSSEGYMPHDLAVVEGARTDRHENYYQKHYPEGYRMDFIGYDNVDTDERLIKAIKLCNRREEQAIK